MTRTTRRKGAGVKSSAAAPPTAGVATRAVEGAAVEGAPMGDAAQDAHVARLEAELRVTKERLQITIGELESAKEELQAVYGELQQRVRNILGVVRSLVARTVRSSDSVDELAASLDGRLNTLARVQGVFTRSGISAVDLEELIRDELTAVAVREEQLDIDGPPLRLRREAAQGMALALHELTTNAVKYGALSEPKGRLAVRWRVLTSDTGGKLLLEWQESGVRALDARPSRSGFGRDLIERGLPYELGACTSLQFARGGVRAVIELPLT